MDLQAAMALANEKSTLVTSNGKTTCPKKKTGLIVLVYGGANDEPLKDVKVKVTGPSKKTDKNGIVKYHPLKAGDYTVVATKPDDAYITPLDEDQSVALGSCPVVMMHIPIGVCPKITIKWDDDKSAVPNVELALDERGGGKYKFKETTSNAGIATRAGASYPPYRYEHKATLDGTVVPLWKDDGQEVGWVDLADGAEHTFYLKRRKMKLRVQVQEGAETKELAGAKVKIKNRNKEETTALVNDQALLEFTQIVLPDKEKSCEIAELTPDGTEDVYEVMEVAST
jgi:hypothetical protein